jgi:hypothetical protein
MECIARHLTVEPPTTLFHYTSLTGLTGIITSKSIWATHIGYLNDPTELTYAIELTKTVLDQEKETANATEAAFLNNLKEELESTRQLNIFVCSFSEDGDLLSQWRGYCPPNGNGFSIGFDSLLLENPRLRQGFFLEKCVYDPECQLTMIKELIDEWRKQFRSPNSAHSGFSVDSLPGWFAFLFVRLGLMLKDPKFSEECEWRMISQSTLTDHPQIDYREGKSMRIPYFDFKLAERERLAISQVIIGPAPDMELSTPESVGNLLSSKEVVFGSIKESAIPYQEC